MKVRKLLRDNQDTVITISIWDGAEYYTLLSNSLVLDKYMNRKVSGWRIGSVEDPYMPGITIYLEKEKDNEVSN